MKIIVAAALFVSGLWLYAGYYYLQESIGFENLWLFLPHEIGQFSVGFFTPLLLIWVIVAQLRQGAQIRRLRRRLGAGSGGPNGGDGGGSGKAEPSLDAGEGAAGSSDAGRVVEAELVDEEEAESEPLSPPKPPERSGDRRPPGARRRSDDGSSSPSPVEEMQRADEESASGDAPDPIDGDEAAGASEGERPPRRPPRLSTGAGRDKSKGKGE